MSDAALRALERAWRETGTEADELAYLRAAVRAGKATGREHYARLATLSPTDAAPWLSRRREYGELASEALQLAAFCGHAPAQLASGLPVRTAADPEAWASALESAAFTETRRQRAAHADRLRRWLQRARVPLPGQRR